MATFLSTPQVITPSGTTGWQSVDVSSMVRNDAVGIIIHVANASTSLRAVGWRMQGSTDDIVGNLAGGGISPCHTWGPVGINSAKQVSLYRDSTDISYRLHGYFTEGEAYFVQDSLAHNRPAVLEWQDCDISSIVQGGHTPIAACVYLDAGSSSGTASVRKKGSTEDRRQPLARTTGFIIGVDSNNMFEFHNANSANRQVYTVGYLFDKAVFPTTSPGNRAPTGDGVWRDLTAALPSGAVGGAYHVFIDGGDGNEAYGMREKGSGLNIVHNTVRFNAFAAVKCDANRLIQANLQTNNIGVWQLGHFEASPALDNGGEGAGVMIRGGLSGGFQ